MDASEKLRILEKEEEKLYKLFDSYTDTAWILESLLLIEKLKEKLR